MTQTIFLRLDTLTARASKTGTVLPSIVLTLCSATRIEQAFVDAEDVVGPLTGTGIVVAVSVKKKPNDEESLLLLTSCPQSGDGTASRRIAEWSDTDMDNDELRALLGDKLSVTGDLDHGPWMEIAVTRSGETARFSFPITIRNAFLRPEDAAPNPRSDASWPWLKARMPDSSGFTHDDEAKTIAATPAWDAVTGKPSSFTPSSHTHTISDVTGLQTALDGKAAASAVGANNGIAPLDSSGKVPAANLPSYVDDVIEAANLAALPGTGETGKLYVTLDTNKTYRWSGSAYVSVDEVPAFASQAEAEAGTDNTKLMTPLRTAQAIAALGGGVGGGGSISRPGEAWLTSDGDNDTAAIGDPSKPFASAQAAFDSGADVIHVGVGSFGDVSLSTSRTVMLIGVGRDVSLIGTISSPVAQTLSGNGVRNITVAAVAITAPDGDSGSGSGANGADGTALAGCDFAGLNIPGGVTLTSGSGGYGYGGDSGSGGAPPANGGNGGAGADRANVTFTDCEIGTVQLLGGDGGVGGTGGSSTDYSAAGGNAGNGGNGGAGGSITLLRSRISVITTGTTTGGIAGGAGSGDGDGSPGTNGANGGDPNIVSLFSVIDGGLSVSTTNIHASTVGGTFIP